MNTKILLLISACLLAINLSAKTITVTSDADAGAGTLREAVTNAENGDVIVFAENITSVYFAGVIIIDKNITISGNETNNTIFQDGTWTDTANKKRFFEILKNAELTLNYLILKDHTSNCTGGTIINDGKLTLNNCTFSNNKPRDSGGAILTTGILAIDNCTFINNYAPIKGGAILNSGQLSIRNSNFKNNSCQRGGAIYSYASSALNATNTNYITNCVFESNTAQYGSAIENVSNLNIDKCVFTENNSTIAFGGTIINTILEMSYYSYVLNGSLMSANSTERNIFISNSTFNKNKSSSREIFINCLGANAIVANCLFAENITQTPPNNSQYKYYPDWQNHGIISSLNLVGYNSKYSISELKSKLTVINTTIADNNAVGLYTNGEIEFYNNIIWDNENRDVFANTTEIVNYANNLIGTSNITLSGNNNIIGEDPLFVGNGDYSLRA